MDVSKIIHMLMDYKLLLAKEVLYCKNSTDSKSNKTLEELNLAMDDIDEAVWALKRHLSIEMN